MEKREWESGRGGEGGGGLSLEHNPYGSSKTGGGGAGWGRWGEGVGLYLSGGILDKNRQTVTYFI